MRRHFRLHPTPWHAALTPPVPSRAPEPGFVADAGRGARHKFRMPASSPAHVDDASPPHTTITHIRSVASLRLQGHLTDAMAWRLAHLLPTLEGRAGGV